MIMVLNTPGTPGMSNPSSKARRVWLRAQGPAGPEARYILGFTQNNDKAGNWGLHHSLLGSITIHQI